MKKRSDSNNEIFVYQYSINDSFGVPYNSLICPPSKIALFAFFNCLIFLPPTMTVSGPFAADANHMFWRQQ